MRKTIPKVSASQRITQKRRLKDFSTKIQQNKNNQTIMIDDECYFSLENQNWCDKYYYEENGSKLTNSSKFVQKSKYTDKIIMWLAISEKGKSTPVFFKANTAINSKIYMNKCLPKLASFINRYHNCDDVLFWPDLASSHYSKDT